MNGRMKISIVSGIIVGLAIVATLHNYSNYKKEKAIETDESSSITSSDHNETTTTTTTAKTTTATTSQTTTTTSIVPIKWVTTDKEKIEDYFGIEYYSDWSTIPSVMKMNTEITLEPPDVAAGTLIPVEIQAKYNADANSQDLEVITYDAIEPSGCELKYCRIEYYESEARAVITGSINNGTTKLVIRNKNTQTELKTIPVELKHKGNKWGSSDPSVLSFNEDCSEFSLNKPGKTTLYFYYGNDIVAQKEIEVVE